MGAAHFCHIKRYFVNVEGGLAALWGDAENCDFCGVSPLAGDGEEVMGHGGLRGGRPSVQGCLDCKRGAP